jgi:lipopolysaccharide transport system permease protein
VGWLWAVIHPLVLLASWTFVFSVCLKQRLPAGQPGSYPLFLFAGMLPWLLFSDTIQRSASSLIEHAGLITKTVFPAEVVPVSVFLSALVSHLAVLALVVVATSLQFSRINPSLLLLPVYMVLLGLLAVGMGWIAAGLQVYLRDTAQVVTVILTLWFWLTPIFITEDQIPARLRFLIAGNPLAYFVRAYREMLLSSNQPPWRDLGIAAAYALGIFVIGGLSFRQLKRGFADVL